MTWIHIEDLGASQRRWNASERAFWDAHFRWDHAVQMALIGGSVAVRTYLVEQLIRVLAVDGYKVTILGEAP